MYLAELLKTSTATPGQWFDSYNLAWPATVTVWGIEAGGAIEVYVSNAPAPPGATVAPGNGAVLYLGNITADSWIAIVGPWRWVGARKATAGTSPSVSHVQMAFSPLA